VTRREISLCVAYLPAAGAIARYYAGLWGGSYDDVYQDACIGLIEAVRRYDRRRARAFGRYVRLKIRGAILDGFRRRSVSWRAARWREPASVREVPLSEAFSLRAETGLTDPWTEARLHRAIARLGDREKYVLHQVYAAGFSLREVAEQLGVSPSRASQIHCQILERLRRALRPRSKQHAVSLS